MIIKNIQREDFLTFWWDQANLCRNNAKNQTHNTHWKQVSKEKLILIPRQLKYSAPNRFSFLCTFILLWSDVCLHSFWKGRLLCICIWLWKHPIACTSVTTHAEKQSTSALGFRNCVSAITASSKSAVCNGCICVKDFNFQSEVSSITLPRKQGPKLTLVKHQMHFNKGINKGIFVCTPPRLHYRQTHSCATFHYRH